MPEPPQPITSTPEDYLRAERQADFKSEFVDGTAVAMSGSLQEYLLVHQDTALVEIYRRHSAGSWLYSRTDGLDNALTVLDLELSLSQLYTGVLQS